MRTYRGSERVRGGFWWDRAEWELTVIPAQGGTLPGSAERRFVRVPVVALLLLGPIMGALFVLFLPAIGVGLLLKNLGVLVAERVSAAIRRPRGQRASSR